MYARQQKPVLGSHIQESTQSSFSDKNNTSEEPLEQRFPSSQEFRDLRWILLPAIYSELSDVLIILHLLGLWKTL